MKIFLKQLIEKIQCIRFKINHLGENVYIADQDHNYKDIDIPIIKQGVWIAKNGITIGKYCILGANSVVNKDIPDYSVAVGSPTRIIKRYDFNVKKWVNL